MGRVPYDIKSATLYALKTKFAPSLPIQIPFVIATTNKAEYVPENEAGLIHDEYVKSPVPGDRLAVLVTTA